ncbi:hypothetical protein OLN08_00790 [Pseudomonas aeruginosa]|nr:MULTISPECIES: hypothetical protein [Pseudomonas]MCF2482574.1 hypothetical protein [Pseudomonas aeruginosa]MCF2510910.1 hypothetical protein [Pseudomonas aeruginosa]MCJ1947755.1 hypothetical protein [Pseudomonas aeruginosa]MCL8375149.1 hypothetical protein [Pseudomonas aeruginosa]MCM8584962.1 hypothetical protein [Pseudomonas aeruginosa]
MDLDAASNTVGLMADCCIGGPVASYLIRRHALLLILWPGCGRAWS